MRKFPLIAISMVELFTVLPAGFYGFIAGALLDNPNSHPQDRVAVYALQFYPIAVLLGLTFAWVNRENKERCWCGILFPVLPAIMVILPLLQDWVS